jgi:hypothetical protein
MALLEFLKSDTLILSRPLPRDAEFLFRIPVGGNHIILVKTKCVSAIDKCYYENMKKGFFQGESDTELLNVEEIYFLYRDGDTVYNQNSRFFRKILGLVPSPITKPTIGGGIVRYSIKNSANLCSIEAVCGLLAAYPDIMLQFFKQQQITTLSDDNFREKLTLSAEDKSELSDAVPMFLDSLQVKYDSLKKEADGFIEYLPEYYPYKSGCSFEYSIQNIIAKLFYEKDKCLTLNHTQTMYLKEEAGKLNLYKKDKTIFKNNVLTIKDEMIELDGTETELLPSLDFIKISDDKKYCLLTFIKDDLAIVSKDTTKVELKGIVESSLHTRIPGVSLANVKILGGVGEKHNGETTSFAGHIIFFVCLPGRETVLIGDSKTPPGEYIRPRMLLLQLATPLPATSRKTFKISSRRFHKTKKLRL